MRHKIRWTPLTTPPRSTGQYVVAHRGHVEVIWYLHPAGSWHSAAKIGWQRDPAAFGATHYFKLTTPPSEDR